VDTPESQFTNEPSANTVDASYGEVAKSPPRSRSIPRQRESPRSSKTSNGASYTIEEALNKPASETSNDSKETQQYEFYVDRRSQTESPPVEPAKPVQKDNKVMVDLTSASPRWRSREPEFKVEPNIYEMHYKGSSIEAEPSPEPDVLTLYVGDDIQKAGLLPLASPGQGHCPHFPRITNLLPSPLDSPMPRRVWGTEEYPGLDKFNKAHEARCRRRVLEEWKASVDAGLDLTTAREQEDRHEDRNETTVETFLLKVDMESMGDQMKRFEASVVHLQQDARNNELRRLQQEVELQRLRAECAVASAEGLRSKNALMVMQAKVADKMDEREKLHQHELDQLRKQLQEREGQQDGDLKLLRQDVSERVKAHEAEIDELRKESERLTVDVTAAHAAMSAKLEEGATADMALDASLVASEGGSTLLRPGSSASCPVKADRLWSQGSFCSADIPSGSSVAVPGGSSVTVRPWRQGSFGSADVPPGGSSVTASLASVSKSEALGRWHYLGKPPRPMLRGSTPMRSAAQDHEAPKPTVRSVTPMRSFAQEQAMPSTILRSSSPMRQSSSQPLPPPPHATRCAPQGSSSPLPPPPHTTRQASPQPAVRTTRQPAHSPQPLARRASPQSTMRSSSPSVSVAAPSIASGCSVGCSIDFPVAAPPPPTCFEHRHFHTYSRAAPKQGPLKFGCPRTHALSRFITPKPGFKCDKCSVAQHVGNVMFGCRQCDFDLCHKCFALPDHSSDVGSAVGSVKIQPRMLEVGSAAGSVKVATRVLDCKSALSSVTLAPRVAPSATHAQVDVTIETIKMSTSYPVSAR